MMVPICILNKLTLQKELQNVLYVFLCVLCVSFCTGRFVMVPLLLTYLHCLQHSFFEHLFN